MSTIATASSLSRIPRLRRVWEPDEEFSPLDLSPTYWFDASDSTTLFDATSGGSLPADNAVVKRWEDKSGNARHATSETGPTRLAAELNGLDVLNFAGTPLFTPAFATIETRQRFAVIYATYYVLVSNANYYNVDPGGDYILATAGNLYVSHYGNSNWSIKYETAGLLNSWIAIMAGYGATHADTKLFLADSELTLTDYNIGDPGTFTKSSAALGIGAYNNGGAAATMKLAEIFEVAGAMTADQISAANQYLMTKWGIT